MTLNKEQKEEMFKTFFTKEDLYKIFETTSIEWLSKQDVRLKVNNYGWYDVLLDNEVYTSINPNAKKGWNIALQKLIN